MNDQTPIDIDIEENAVQRWADSHMILWDAEDGDHCIEVRNWMAENCPLQMGSGCEMLKEYQTSPTSGMVILEFDEEEMTDSDAEHLQQWLWDLPTSQVIYQAMVSLGGIVRINDDDPEIEIGPDGPSATLH